jgi:uncharacterized protein (DUF2147 family)
MRFFDRRALAGALLAAVALASAASAAAAPQEAEGVWIREDGASKIRIAPCGNALCGDVIWLKSPRSKAHVGQKVFFDMVRADQNSWKGHAFNPADGKVYSGRMVVSGKKLRTSGCVFGGLICKTVYWVRSN